MTKFKLIMTGLVLAAALAVGNSSPAQAATNAYAPGDQVIRVRSVVTNPNGTVASDQQVNFNAAETAALQGKLSSADLLSKLGMVTAAGSAGGSPSPAGCRWNIFTVIQKNSSNTSVIWKYNQRNEFCWGYGIVMGPNYRGYPKYNAYFSSVFGWAWEDQGGMHSKDQSCYWLAPYHCQSGIWSYTQGKIREFVGGFTIDYRYPWLKVFDHGDGTWYVQWGADS